MTRLPTTTKVPYAVDGRLAQFLAVHSPIVSSLANMRACKSTKHGDLSFLFSGTWLKTSDLSPVPPWHLSPVLMYLCHLQGEEIAAALPQPSISAQGTTADSELRNLLTSMASQSAQLSASPEVLTTLLRTLTMQMQQMQQKQ